MAAIVLAGFKVSHNQFSTTINKRVVIPNTLGSFSDVSSREHPLLSTAVPSAFSFVHEGTAHGGRTDHSPTAATSPGAEGKRGVKWGTVKTHKVYVVDSDGDDNGNEVRS